MVQELLLKSPSTPMATSPASDSGSRRGSGSMKPDNASPLKIVGVCLMVAGVVVAGLWYRYGHANSTTVIPKTVATKESGPAELTGERDAMKISADVFAALGVQFAEVRVAPPPEQLKLQGSLFIDPSRLARVHSRFMGDVASIGLFEGPASDAANAKIVKRPLEFLDVVKKGQALAVVWSKEVGEKKSELVDALSRLRLKKSTVDRLKSLNDGTVPKKAIYEAEQDYQAAVIAVEKAERTLNSWLIPAEDLHAIHQEADRIRDGHEEGNPEVARTWAEIPILAPFDGVILEVNVTAGQHVDTNEDLFQIADLSRLKIYAQAYEDDLPLLAALTPEQRKWTVFFHNNGGQKPLQGTFGLVGEIIDPSQHTATIIGGLNNIDRQFKVGQFVTANVILPQQSGEVSVPSTAVVEEGAQSYVLVASGADRTHLARRKVAISRHGVDRTCIRTNLTDQEVAAGLQTLVAGKDVVVASSVLELEAELENLQALKLAKE